MIKYLIKFVSKEKYADDLLDGKLFMHCVDYYHDLENKYGPGQGDLREGSLFPNTLIYKRIYYPIYCTYMVKDEDIIDGQVIIDKRVIQDFDCQQGYMVLIPFELFQQVLPTADTGGAAMDGMEVWYGIPNQDGTDKMFKCENALNLMVKNPYFRYQKEFRLVVYKNLYQDSFPECSQKERTFTCSLAMPINDIAKKIPISYLQETDIGFLLKLSDIVQGGQDVIVT